MMKRSSYSIQLKQILASVLFIGALGMGAAFAQTAFNDPGVSLNTPGGGTSSGGLVAVDPDIKVEEIDPGMNNNVIVQFRNESGSSIEFVDVKLFPSSNVSARVISDQCSDSSAPLEPGAQCAIVTEIKGLQSGSFRTEVLARHTGRSRLVTATISGTVRANDDDKNRATDIEITPNPIDFGSLTASRPVIRSVTVRNITSQEITVNDVYIEAPEASGFALKTNCAKLAAGASCIASITWSPVTRGPSSGSLVIDHTGATGIASVNLTGQFAPEAAEAAEVFPDAVPGKGLLVSSEKEVDFGTEVDSQSSITVSLVNVGDAPLTLQNLSLSGSEHGLSIVQQGCRENMTLEPTEACPLTVAWSPSKAGAVIDDVRVRHTGARGVLVLPVRGTSTGTVNKDTVPIVSIVESTTSPVTGQTETRVSTNAPAGVGSGGGALAEQAGPPVMDGYSISSLSQRHAIINGPGGSRMVRDGQRMRLAGREWLVNVVPDGVTMASGNNRVTLIFDRSLATPGSNNSSTTVSSTTVAPAAAAASSTATTGAAQ